MIRILALMIMTVLLSVACATTQEETEPPAEEIPVAKAPEPVRPSPAPTPVAQEVEPVHPPAAPARTLELPKTASPMPMVGLAGLGSVSLAGALHLLRRRL